MKRTTRRTLIACAAALSCSLGFGVAIADPCDSPTRMVNGQAVDLTPLLEWWSNGQAGERPLSGWKHIRGRIIGETAYGWIIQGEAEGESLSAKFLLRNPPRERLQKFQALEQQLLSCERERVYLNDYLDLPVRSPYDGHSDSTVPSISWSDQVAAVTRLQELARTIPSLRQELGQCQDERGNFRLDAFALRLSERYQGFPVFDHGYSLPASWSPTNLSTQAKQKPYASYARFNWADQSSFEPIP